ncbi:MULTISPECIES: LuxR C-terminal-related transcriptional regulator [Burkholderia]|uniref:LuxR family transcriptional regulator n=1 Tax=Burkholderia aenigmatica TaxID=2015348 RepID=A0A6J5INW2_9BURK|nr:MULTISPECIES: LuxR C-terminal-related transcriptional regulator [Burkholderia]CAB3961091.1 LuxR family transcriptional regulator [Burkholderia aenigmatica]
MIVTVSRNAIPRSVRHDGVDLREHKFSPPAARRGAIVRHALLERVTRLGVPHVVILHAPLGSGKSTLLRQIMEIGTAKRWTVGWLTLDESDNDPRRFETYFIALVTQMVADAGGPAPEQSPATTDNMIDWVLDRFGQIPGPIGLCIDDLQWIRDPAILRFLRDLLRALPGRCRIYIGSRNLPDIGVSTLLVAEEALVLRMEDLRFSPEESVEFMTARDDGVLDAEIASFVQARTEGWPAGLQLFKLALARGNPWHTVDEMRDCGPLELVRYLSENTLSLQPPDVQVFLLKTSLLRRLNGSLCAEATGTHHADAMLQRLEQDGLFLEALDGNPGWYRYHSLFARFLSDRLGQDDPDGVLDVHRRAAHWYVRHGVPEEAMYHAVEAREYALAVRTLDEWASRLIAGAELATVVYWFDRLPLNEVLGNRSLAIKVAWALVFLRRGSPTHPLLSYLDQTRAGEHDGTAHNPDVVLAMATMFNNDLRGAARLANIPVLHQPARDIFEAFELGAAANLLTFSAMATWNEEDIHHMLVLANSHNDHAQAAFSQGYTLALRCILQVTSGQPRLATEAPRATSGTRPWPYVNRGMAAVALAASRIWACYEADALDIGERLATQFEDEIALAAVPEFIALSMVSIARIHAARGRMIQARDTLDTLERLSFQSQWSGVRQMIAWERLYFAGRSGDAARVDALLQHVTDDASPSDPVWIPITEMLSGRLLGRIRLALFRQQLDRACELLKAALAITPARPLLSVKLHVLQALVQHRQGHTRLALRTLQGVRETANAGGCRRALLDEGAELVALLDQSPDAEMPHTAQASEPRFHTAAWYGALSQREQEILRLLCSGASNREISEKLFLSENTVKFHLKNVYLKLDVKNRAQAILKAQLDLR